MLNFDSRRLSHAYIAQGDAAEIIAATVLCLNRTESGPCIHCKHCQKTSRKIHPDIISLSKSSDARYFTVDQIRDLKKDVIVVPNEAEKKVYILNDAHFMNENAQNAFLRILEEPPEHVVFILETRFPTMLLPTILSRCILVKSELNNQDDETSKSIAFKKDSNPTDDDFDSKEIAAMFFSAIEKGNLAITEYLFTIDKLSKDQFVDFITSARNEASMRLRLSASDNTTKSKVAKADKLLVKASGFLDQNVNIGHISGYICANLIDIS